MAPAALHYEDALRELPPIYVSTDQRWRLPPTAPNPAKPYTMHGLHIYLLPFMEYQPIYDQYDFSVSWNNSSSSKNSELIKTNIPEFICPTAPSIEDRSGVTVSLFTGGIPGGFADYGIDGRVYPATRCQMLATGFRDRPHWTGLFTGGEIFATGSWAMDCPGDAPGSHDPIPNQTGITKLKQCTDGLSHTILFSPDAGRPFIFENRELKVGVASGSQWGSPDHEWWTHKVCPGGNSIMNCYNDNETYSFHSGGGVYSFGDGSARFVSDDIDLELQISLMTALVKTWSNRFERELERPDSCQNAGHWPIAVFDPYDQALCS